VDLDPGNYRALFYLMRFYLEAPAMLGGGASRARDLIARTGKTNPAASILLQASMDARSGNYEHASTAALSVNPGDSEALATQQKTLLMNIGNALVNQKKYTQAQKLFFDITQRYPAYSGGYFGIGKVMQETGKQVETITYMEKSLRLDSSASACYRMAKAWQALGDKPKAISFYEKALDFSPGLNKDNKTDAENQLKVLR
jgi:tetratricopeptide (TPR) repeat protein